ncbi:MAG: hypothetical protein K1X92_12635 [Bacteroidia bacterium]|nr:hypothetical protein [Bacteroidia bacterium]
MVAFQTSEAQSGYLLLFLKYIEPLYDTLTAAYIREIYEVIHRNLDRSEAEKKSKMA